MNNNGYIFGIREELEKINILHAVDLYYSIICDRFNLGELTVEEFSDSLNKITETVSDIIGLKEKELC